MRNGPWWIALGLVSCALALAPACQKEKETKDEGKTADESSAARPAEPPPKQVETEEAPAKPTPKYEHPAMLDPSKATEKAPDSYKVKFETSKGDFVVEVTRKWSPNGADRVYNLVKMGYFSDVKFFRAVPKFMVQFGIHGDPQVNAAWRNANLQDDLVVESNKRGYVTFAKAAMPNSRSTQLFINFKDNTFLDQQGFAPIGKVVEGMEEVVDSLEQKYGEAPSQAQGRIQMDGNSFLDQTFPDLDYIKQATIVE